MTLRVTRSAAFALLLFLSAAPLLAEWYDDYADGLSAARKGQWQVVVEKMSAAIAKNPKENDRARTYGMGFIAYHPYYYRGAAYFELGQFQRASDDLSKATGMGEVKLPSLDLDVLQMKVQARLAQASAPPPTNTAPPPPSQRPAPTNTVPPAPVQPVIDAALEQAKQRASLALNQASTSHNTAQDANAPTFASATFIQATETLGDARTRAAMARSTADWQEVAQLADKSRGEFDLSHPRPELPTAHQQSRPVQATDLILKDEKNRVRRALEDYYNGRYESSSREFQSLAGNELPEERPDLGVPRRVPVFAVLPRRAAVKAPARFAAEDSFRHARALRRDLKELPPRLLLAPNPPLLQDGSMIERQDKPDG